MSELPPRLLSALADRYAIERELGEGGMATVYLARDLKHNRKVALKVLRPELAAVLGTERFLPEIQVTANLQHPHLLPLFDSGQADGLLYYIMPYVEGESLRSRLERERQLPVEDALRIAAAVASALDYAHQHGVIHRDLKPENILLQAGQPVVADFGIALAVSNAGGARITQTGISLGTPQYMSPEQATSDHAIDGRADVYSLGCVLYEMLTGEAPHTGKTTQAVIARLLTETPRSVRVMRPSVAPHVDAAILKALEKLPADRWATAREFAHVLQARSGDVPTELQTATADSHRRASQLDAWAAVRRGLPWLATPVLAIGAGILGWNLRPEAPFQVVRWEYELPDLRLLARNHLAFSPDGSQFVYNATDGLYLRPLGELGARMIPGTAEELTSPFFSPDSRWIGYWANGQLKKIAVTGGTPVELSQTNFVPFGASWADNDTIIWSDGRDIMSVSADGGTSETLIPGEGEYLLFPAMLPGGKAVLMTSVRGGEVRTVVHTLASGERKTLVEGGSQALYVPTGHLVYGQGASLFAVPFDLRRLEVGVASLVASDVRRVANPSSPNAPFLSFGFSKSGTLVYLAGDAGDARRTPAWVDRQGRKEAIPLPPRAYVYPRISPDGRRVAFDVRDQELDIWIWDRSRETQLIPLTLDPGRDRYPVWFPDSEKIAFSSDRGGSQGNLFWQSADGTGGAQRLTESSRIQLPTSFSPDGQLIFEDRGAGLATVGTNGGSPAPLVDTTTILYNAEVSPNGRWLAFESSGEIYVRPFPDVVGGEWQVSTGGGRMPLWARSGRELFYVNPAGQIMSASIAPGERFSWGSPQVAVEKGFAVLFGGILGRTYDVAPDGRFLVLADVATAPRPKIVVVQNWFEELKRLSPN